MVIIKNVLFSLLTLLFKDKEVQQSKNVFHPIRKFYDGKFVKISSITFFNFKILDYRIAKQISVTN